MEVIRQVATSQSFQLNTAPAIIMTTDNNNKMMDICIGIKNKKLHRLISPNFFHMFFGVSTFMSMNV